MDRVFLSLIIGGPYEVLAHLLEPRIHKLAGSHRAYPREPRALRIIPLRLGVFPVVFGYESAASVHHLTITLCKASWDQLAS